MGVYTIGVVEDEYTIDISGAIVSGAGDVVGPLLAVDEDIVVFDLSTGKLIKDHGINISAVIANTAKITNATHTGDVTGSVALTIAADAVTYAKMQNVVNDERILGRVSGANGIVEELTKTEVLTMINVENGADVTDAINVAAAGAAMTAGTPVNNQIGIWTGAGTIEGVAEVTYDGSTFEVNNDFAITANKKLYLEGSSGDTYFTYNSTRSKVELWVNNTKKQEWG